jgi:hypothetical protein
LISCEILTIPAAAGILPNVYITVIIAITHVGPGVVSVEDLYVPSPCGYKQRERIVEISAWGQVDISAHVSWGGAGTLS